MHFIELAIVVCQMRSLQVIIGNVLFDFFIYDSNLSYLVIMTAVLTDIYIYIYIYIKFTILYLYLTIE